MNSISAKTKVLIVFFAFGLYSVDVKAELIAHWKLDEIVGRSASDSSGNGNTGTLQGDLAWAPTEGKYGGALLFGLDENSCVEISTQKLFASRGTIALWANLAADPQPGGDRYLFGHRTTPAPIYSNRLQLYLNNNDHELDLGLGDSHFLLNNIKTLQPGTWYHIALTWDRGNFVVYVNGLSEATGTYAGLDELNSVADIGNNGFSVGSRRDNSFYGLIDDLLIFNHALTGDEISLIYKKSSKPTAPPDLIELFDNVRRAEQFIKEQEYRKAINFLKEKIAEHEQWKANNSNDIKLHHKLLSYDLLYLLAKATEATNAPDKEIITDYKKSVSEILYRRNYVPALLWLFTNSSTDDYIDAIAKSINNYMHIPEDLHFIAEDFESSRNWEAFVLFLDTVCNKLDNTNCFAKAIAEGLKKNSSWADNFIKYSRNNPKLTHYYFEVSRQLALEKIKQNDFQQAAYIYRDILNQCDSKHDKLVYELKIYECFLYNGKYDEVLSQLNSFIDKNNSAYKDLITDALLLKGQVYMQLRDYDRAYDTFSQLIVNYPEARKVPDAKFFIGYCKMLEGKIDEAKEFFDFIFKHYPDSSYVSKSRLCLWKTGNPKIVGTSKKH